VRKRERGSEREREREREKEAFARNEVILSPLQIRRLIPGLLETVSLSRLMRGLRSEMRLFDVIIQMPLERAVSCDTSRINIINDTDKLDVTATTVISLPSYE